MKQHAKNKFDEKKLFSFARSYFAEAFPNPDRIGCPPEGSLRRLAESPTSADLSITEHIGRCSPCFREYQQLLAEIQARRSPIAVLWNRRRSIPIVIAAAICLVVILLSVALWTVHRREIAHPGPTPAPGANVAVVAKYVPVVLDMRATTTVRGNNETKDSVMKLSRMPLHISVYLPIGADTGEYAISFENGGKSVWSGAAVAQQRGQDTLLEFERDFTSYSTGQYILTVSSKSGMHFARKLDLENSTKPK